MRTIRYSFSLSMLITVAIIVAVAGLLFTRLQNKESPNEKAWEVSGVKPAEKAPEVSVPGLPIRLKIPKINVNASVEGLGLTESGDLEAPKGTDNVGWYNAGHRPGSVGNAVMDGHFGRADGKPAVFDKLHTLKKGDLMYVEDGNGGTHTFVVTEVRLFKPDEDASIVFRSSDNKAHLNLITCQGAWDNRKDSYSARLVVMTDLSAD